MRRPQVWVRRISAAAIGVATALAGGWATPGSWWWVPATIAAGLHLVAPFDRAAGRAAVAALAVVAVGAAEAGRPWAAILLAAGALVAIEVAAADGADGAATPANRGRQPATITVHTSAGDAVPTMPAAAGHGPAMAAALALGTVATAGAAVPVEVGATGAAVAAVAVVIALDALASSTGRR